MNNKMKMEAGQQPLDRYMNEADLKNNDLVNCSEARLTHKQVSKARKGRRITMTMSAIMIIGVGFYHYLVANAKKGSMRMECLYRREEGIR